MRLLDTTGGSLHCGLKLAMLSNEAKSKDGRLLSCEQRTLRRVAYEEPCLFKNTCH
jgi:hypothetical protein